MIRSPARWKILLLLAGIFAGGGYIGPDSLVAQPTPSPGPGVSVPFIRADANGDETTDIADSIRILSHLFQGIPLSCLDSGDVNDDEVVDIADPITLFAYLFQQSAPPPPPWPECGPDPTASDTLSCLSFPICPTTLTDRATAAHVLRRIAYGGTLAEITDLETIGADEFILEQLDPLSIPENPTVDTKIATVPISSNYANYYRHVLFRGRYSARQLLEQMTDFWSNHFNTYFWTVRSFLRDDIDGGTVYDENGARIAAMIQEALEDQVLRDNALGIFEDLVLTSATSPTMLIYLDNVSNVAGNPNENYARELLELHTVGVNGGYTQADIEELARCFTGWTIQKVNPADYGDPFAPAVPNDDPTGVFSFKFDPATHDYDQKQLFSSMGIPLTIPQRAVGSVDGVLDGFEVIAHLSDSSLTAEYISSKLIQKFVTDDPPPALIADCIGTWLSTGGNMRDVMETILFSPEFRGLTYRFGKVKTPMENLLSTVRTIEGETTNAQQILTYTGRLQHVPLNFGTPDGYPELGDDWMGTAKLVDTIHFNQIIYEGSSQLSYNPRDIQIAASIDENDPDMVVDFWLELMFPGGYNQLDRGLAYSFFTTDDNGVPVALSNTTVTYDLQLRKFLAFLRSWPQAMKQ